MKSNKTTPVYSLAGHTNTSFMLTLGSEIHNALLKLLLHENYHIEWYLCIYIPPISPSQDVWSLVCRVASPPQCLQTQSPPHFPA